MQSWVLALLIKPLVLIVVFVSIVAPTSWVLYKAIPAGRLKQILFKERTSVTASFRDKAIMTGCVIAFYLLLGLSSIWMK